MDSESTHFCQNGFNVKPKLITERKHMCLDIDETMRLATATEGVMGTLRTNRNDSQELTAKSL